MNKNTPNLLATDATKPLPDYCFRTLDCDEVIQFKKWARDNYKVGSKISGIWHPIIRSECTIMNQE